MIKQLGNDALTLESALRHLFVYMGGGADWRLVVALASYSLSGLENAQSFATLTAFLAIGPVCLIAGRLADRFGEAEIALQCMVLSGACALLAAVSFGGPVWLYFAIYIAWGITIIPDSALFSALVADNAPLEQTGSLMTLQTALCFALTFITVQLTPVMAELFGWPMVLAGLALGSATGIAAMNRLRHP